MQEPTIAEESLSVPSVPSLPPRTRLLVAGLMVVLAAGIYANSVATTAIVHDGVPGLIENENIRSLWTAFDTPIDTTLTGRPVAQFTFAVNYLISGQEPWSYVFGNVLIHVLAGLTLFGVVRRTLHTSRLARHFEGVQTQVALIVAAIWLVHPLQTAAVAYVVQRVEALMGLFFLLSFYALLRSAQGGSRAWFGVVVAAVLLGMGCKEVMAMAPILLVIFDRIFLATDWRETFRRRWPIYAGCLLGYAVLIALLVVSGTRSKTVGYGLEYSVWQYLTAQANMIVHYLAMSFWPSRLMLDYGRPIPGGFGDYAAWGFFVLALLAATAWALWRRPALGFLGAWFFLILAPTSSFLPITTEIGADFRMYLPLAAVVMLTVSAVMLLGGRLLVKLGWTERQHVGRSIGGVLAAVAIIALGARTIDRNHDYRSRIAIWEKTLQDVRRHVQGHTLLGNLYIDKAEEIEDPDPQQLARQRAVLLKNAERHYLLALKFNPNYVNARVQLARVRSRRDIFAVMEQLSRAVKSQPNNLRVRAELATMMFQTGMYEHAQKRYENALQVAQRSEDAQGKASIYNGYAWMLAACPKEEYRNGERALELAGKALSLNPDRKDAVLDTLAAAYAETGQFDKAVDTQREAVDKAEELHQSEPDQMPESELQRYRERLELYRNGKPYRGI